MDRLDIQGHNTVVALGPVVGTLAVAGNVVWAAGIAVPGEGVGRIEKAVAHAARAAVVVDSNREEALAPAEPVVAHTTRPASYSPPPQPSFVPSTPPNHSAPASTKSHSPSQFSPSHPSAIKPSSTYSHTPSTFNTHSYTHTTDGGREPSKSLYRDAGQITLSTAD